MSETQYEKGQAYQYDRPDGIAGVGHCIDFAGRLQHSVSWPDKIAERYMDDELVEKSIQVKRLQDDQDDDEDAINDPAASAKVKVDSETFVHDPDATEAANIRGYLIANPEASNQDVIAALHELKTEVSSSQVTAQRKRLAKVDESDE